MDPRSTHRTRGGGRISAAVAGASLLVLALATGGCGGTARATPAGPCGQIVNVVAAENVWGNVAAQIGGACVHVTSILNDPRADPHLYESDPRDAGSVARARVVIENGVGYDRFMTKLVDAASRRGRIVVVVGQVLGTTGNDPNPHLWYDIARVPQVAARIEEALVLADRADQALFEANLKRFTADLAPIETTLGQIKAKYANAPVAYTERVSGYLLAAAGLVVKTPPGFALAIENGNEPSPGDTQAMMALLTGDRVKALVYNSQATSPVTQHIRDLAGRARIPVVGFSETMPSEEPTYQAWQLHQAQSLLAALGG